MPSSVNPIRSMTGYAQVRRETSAGEFTVTLRSVNHRGLDIHFPHLGEMAVWENASRTLLKQYIRRGRVEVRFALTHGAESAGPSYNREMLSRYLKAFEQASAEFGLSSRPDLNVLFSLPGIFEIGDKPKPVEGISESDVLDALQACAVTLNDYREREGQELKAALSKEIDAIVVQAQQMIDIRKEAQPYFYKRLRERLAEMLQEIVLDEGRLAAEAAILADRSDISEELTRLAVHTEELRRVLEEGGEVGKRLDFLLQEMNRETNTILSKTSGLGDPGLTMTNLALAAKASIEKIREQALNLE